jgi:hypothetical protein
VSLNCFFFCANDDAATTHNNVLNNTFIFNKICAEIRSNERLLFARMGGHFFLRRHYPDQVNGYDLSPLKDTPEIQSVKKNFEMRR